MYMLGASRIDRWERWGGTGEDVDERLLHEDMGSSFQGGGGHVVVLLCPSRGDDDDVQLLFRQHEAIVVVLPLRCDRGRDLLTRFRVRVRHGNDAPVCAAHEELLQSVPVASALAVTYQSDSKSNALPACSSDSSSSSGGGVTTSAAAVCWRSRQPQRCEVRGQHPRAEV